VSLVSGVARRFTQPTREMLGDLARGPLMLLPGVVVLIIIRCIRRLATGRLAECWH